MNILYHFENYLNYLYAEKDASELTVISYTRDLEDFDKFLYENGISRNMRTLTTPIIRRFIAYLKIDRELASSTIRRKIHSMSSYFKYLYENDIIKDNPMKPIHAPKRPESVPKYLDKSEIGLLLNAPYRFPSDNTVRNEMILYVFIYTGIRKSELQNLKWDSIDFKNNTITIRSGKGNKDRIIPMSKTLQNKMWDYLQHSLPMTSKYVFTGYKTNDKMSLSTIQQAVVRYYKKLGFDEKGYTIHTLRHTFASHLAQNQVPVLTIAKLMGHSDLMSTQVYAHLNNKELVSGIDVLENAF